MRDIRLNVRFPNICPAIDMKAALLAEELSDNDREKEESMPKPLENVKVLDLTRVLAGPYCTMLLKELGAEVIKVEMPGKGDDARSYGPFKDNKSVYFISINRGKKSISLNLKHEKGKQIIYDLVKQVDVVTDD